MCISNSHKTQLYMTGRIYFSFTWLKICWDSGNFRSNQEGLYSDFGISSAAPCASHSSETHRLPRICSLGSDRNARDQTKQKGSFPAMVVSYPLTPHWPKHVTWPSSTIMRCKNLTHTEIKRDNQKRPKRDWAVGVITHGFYTSMFMNLSDKMVDLSRARNHKTNWNGMSRAESYNY